MSVHARDGAPLAEEAAAEAKAGAAAQVAAQRDTTEPCLVPGVSFTSLEAAAAEAAAEAAAAAAAEAATAEAACTVEIMVRHRRTFGRQLCILSGECVHQRGLGAEGRVTRDAEGRVTRDAEPADGAAAASAPRLLGEGNAGREAAIFQVVLDYTKLGEAAAVVDVDFSDPKLELRGERVRASGVAHPVAKNHRRRALQALQEDRYNVTTGASKTDVAETPSVNTPHAPTPREGGASIVQLKATEVALLKPFVARARDDRLRTQGLAAMHGAAAGERANGHGGAAAEEEAEEAAEADVAAAFVSSGGGGDEAEAEAEADGGGGGGGGGGGRTRRKLRFRARPATEAALVMASRLDAAKRPEALCKAVLGGHALRVSALASLGVRCIVCRGDRPPSPTTSCPEAVATASLCVCVPVRV